MQIREFIGKALQLSLGAAALAATSSAHADYQNQSAWSQDVECYHQVCNFMDEWCISLDSLWWEANQDGLALGKEIFVSRNGLDAAGNYDLVIKDTKVKELNFQCDTGWRFSFGHALPDYLCDMKFSWTHFYTQAKARGNSSIHPDAENYHHYTAFQPYWESVANNFPNATKGTWRLYMDLFDLDIGRRYGISSCFQLRPHFGLRCARVNQKYHVRSCSEKNPLFDLNGSSYNYTSQTTAISDFVGVGPRFGCDVEFNMCWGLSLFGQGAGSLVYGKADRRSHEQFLNSDDYYLKFNEFDGHVRGQKEEWRSRAITDLAIGIKWHNKCSLLGFNFPFMIALSWEHHAFYDFNNFDVDAGKFTNSNREAFDFGPYANLLPSQKKSGTLYTQGLTLTTRFGF